LYSANQKTGRRETTVPLPCSSLEQKSCAGAILDVNHQPPKKEEKPMRFNKLCVFILVAALIATTSFAVAGTLEDVKARGYLLAGVNGSVAGFSMPDEKGEWKGLDVDTAKAIAAAIFGDANKIKYTALTAVQRLPALQSKEIDVLCRNTTATLTRETTNGLNFVHVNFYDGQAFLVPKKLGVKSAKELGGATVCVLPGTTTELNAADFFRKNKMQWNPVVIENTAELTKAFFAGRCDVYTSDGSQLAAHRSTAPNPADYVLLPEVISKEPLAPVVRHGDDVWYDIVNWTVMALLQAEEFGITSNNIDEMLNSNDPQIQRFLGVTPGLGKALGLDEKWAYNIIKQIGNYGEIFDRNVGPKTPLGLERGLNAQWYDGGLMYADPFR
jgi:general L-amino acid transport system substrate-binding protein